MTAPRPVSTNRRSHQTVNNLVYSLLVCLGIVVLIVLLVPRNSPTVTKDVDYAAVAAQGQGTEPDALAVPHLPDTWRANAAELRQGASSHVDEWYIGLITPDTQYIGFTQGFDANDTWLANLLHNTRATGATTIDGITWTVYDNRHSSQDVGNAQYALTTSAGASTYVLYGSAEPADFKIVAKSLTTQIRASSQKGN